MAQLKKDGRKLEHGILEWIRKEAVKRVVKGSESPEAVIASYGLASTNIYKWIRLYKRGGWKALKSTKAKGPEKKITKKEEKQLKRWLVKDPRQLHFNFGLWTLEMIQQLIKQKFHKELHVTTVDRLLDRMGYTHQKPLFRAWQQDSARVQKWLDEEYPAIKKEAKKEGRNIFFEDEAGFRSTDTKGKTWATRGKRPIVRTTGARFGFNAISAVSAKGELRFSIYEENFDGDVFIDFLNRLLDGVHGKITLIVDGHPVHKRKKVQEFVNGTKGKLKLYFLPPYSPERNPDEFIWQAAKAITKRAMITGPEQFKLQVGSILHSLQKRKERIISIFSNPDVIYAKIN